MGPAYSQTCWTRRHVTTTRAHRPEMHRQAPRRYPSSPQAPVTLANAAASKTASERLMSLSPEERRSGDRTLTETLHQMGQSSQAYQLQLRHLAVHYQHQAAHGGQVDPQLLHQIYTTKMNLQNLSAYHVHFRPGQQRRAIAPSPMRQAAAGPPPGPEAAPAPDVKRSVEVDNRAPTTPADFPSLSNSCRPKSQGTICERQHSLLPESRDRWGR